MTSTLFLHMPQVWAMLLYLDDVLGRLFDAVADSFNVPL
jgi:hypothetical protein